MRARLPTVEAAYQAAAEVRRLSPNLVLEMRVEKAGDHADLLIPDGAREAATVRWVIPSFGGSISSADRGGVGEP